MTLQSTEILLDQVYQACLDADFSALAVLTQEIDAISAQSVDLRDKETLAVLQQKALRNERALLACLRGVSAAQRRLKELGSSNLSKTIYSRKGEKISLVNQETRQRRV
jgi:predicted Zn-dependent protease with MMP-like domain